MSKKIYKKNYLLLFGWTIVFAPFKMTAKVKGIEFTIENPQVELLIAQFIIAFILILLGVELFTSRFSKLIEKYIELKYNK